MPGARRSSGVSFRPASQNDMATSDPSARPAVAEAARPALAGYPAA
jgi:hypothetical protein